MNVKAGAIGLVVIVAGGWAAGVSYSGKQVRAALAQQTAEWQQPGSWIRVVDSKTDEGWLTTTRTMTVDVGPPVGATADAQGLASVRLKWRDHVDHGPLPGFRGVGAARITSELTVDDSQRAALKGSDGAEPAPITAETAVDWAGGSDTRFASPAFALPLAGTMRYTWQGLTGRLQREASGRTQHELTVPTVRFQDERTGVAMSMNELSSKGEGLPGTLMPFGLPKTFEMRVAKLEMNVPTPPTATGGTPALLQLQDLKATSTGSLDQQLYSAVTEFSATGQFNSQKIEALSLKSTIKRLHVPTYQALMPDLMSGAPAGADADAATAEALAKLERMKGQLLKLLPYDPQIDIAPLAVTVNGATGTLSYSLGTQGVTEADLAGPALMAVLPRKLRFTLDAAIPQAWVQAVAAGSVPAGGQAPDVDKLMIEPAVAQGFVTRDGAMLKASLQFAEGALSLNGKPIPLPGLPPMR